MSYFIQHIKGFVIAIVVLVCSLSPVFAQTYPVQANVYIAPPYSSYLSDYYTGSREKLIVTLLNRDQQKPMLEVRLRMTITAVNGLKLQSREESNYPGIILDAGIPVRLTPEDLAPYFRTENLLTQGSFREGKLPDGMVEFSFQAIERYTGKALSAMGTGRLWLTTQKPPLLRLPDNNDDIAFLEPLNIRFQWEPQHRNLSQVEY
ncbi:MAG: hypothetical protein LBO74_03410, partial [Candidatus Symbiothrix sp.]|nr:hypothetical protein [Candidatus Symbiothrix sp.]